MNSNWQKVFRIIRKKELLIFLILFVAGVGLYGWLSGNMIFASYSPKYIPIAPSNIVIVILLSLVFIYDMKLKRSHFLDLVSIQIVLLLALFCLIIFLQYFFNLSWDIENTLIRNPVRLGKVLIGRMSPITSLLYIFICTGILGIRLKNPVSLRYLGGSFTLLALVVSSVLLIGYLYKAPLLYGSKIIPVSLPSAICFFLFSIALLREYESRFLILNLLRENKVARLLLKSFLPIVVFIVILQGYLITIVPVAHQNPTLSVALILLIIVSISVMLLIRVSSTIGGQLLSAEQKLKESEEKFRSIMENSADAIYLTDKFGKYLYTNKAASNMLGYTAEELKSMTMADLSPPARLEEYLKIYNRIVTEGKAFAEIELVKKDGKYIATDLNSVVLPNGLVFASCRDITERRQAEQALKESDTKYRMIADYNYDWEFWLTNEKRFKYNSPSCERISGYNPVDFSNNPDLFNHIVHPEDLPSYEKHLDNLYNKPCDGLDFRIITRSGEVRWINHVCQPIYNESGVNIGRRGSNCDITRRKTAEDKIQELNRKLKELNTDKDRFISILSHDLKSPFNILLGLSDLLFSDIRKYDLEQIEIMADSINKTATKTYNLLEDILMWASTQQGNIPFEPLKLDLGEVCTDVIDILKPAADKKSIAIHCISGDPLFVFADINMLKSILRNLVSNAIKFTRNGGSIIMDAVQSQAKITISVSDNGIGIKPDLMPGLFDISQILSTPGTANEEGTGLGLILCREFIEKHGGKIWVESEHGKGSKFLFTLPKAI
jgi:PAS domain S-box-containing protein